MITQRETGGRMSDLLKYKLVGAGPKKVIVLHDWSVSCEGNYEYALPFFDLEQLTMAFVDIRGYGLSKTLKGSYTTDEITSDVDAVAVNLGWDKFSIIGHSMTGMAVQKIMCRLPKKVEKVVATVPVPASGFPLDDETFGFFASMAHDDDAFKSGMHALTSEIYGHGWADQKLKQNRNSVDADAMEKYAAMWSKEDFSTEVQGCNTPILVVFGAEDNEGLRADATADKFKSWYPNYEQIIMETGHYPMVEAPVAYAKAVQDFLLS